MSSYLRNYLPKIDEAICEHETKIETLENLRSHLVEECGHEETYVVRNEGTVETYCGICGDLLEYTDLFA